MTISMTIREIFDKGLWDKVCEIKGRNVWIVNEGRATMSEVVEFDNEEIKKLLD